MRDEPGQIGRRLAELAARQHGVVAHRQLCALGLSRAAIGRWAQCGRLHAVHRGVYAVGHALLTPRGRWMAAVLAAGDGAALSHRSAAALWDLRASGSGPVEVTSMRRATPREGIRVRRGRSLLPEEVTERDGIAVTTVERTLLDLAGVVPRRILARACDQAEVERVLDHGRLCEALERHPRVRGAAALRRLLAEHAIGGALTRSELEDRFLAICRRARLPRPEVNVPVALPDGTVCTVDVLWPAHRLVAETDGWRFHSTRAAFERDRRITALLTVAGYEVVRFTWRQVLDERDVVVAILQARLAARRPPSSRSAR